MCFARFGPQNGPQSPICTYKYMKKKRNKSDFSLFIQKFSLIFAVQMGD